MTNTSEEQSQADHPESKAPSRQSSRKSILALSVFALGLNATAAVYTQSPSDFALPNVASLVDLIPHLKGPDPADTAVAASKDIQPGQQQPVASLQENNLPLQQNAALPQQDSITLASLRQSVVDEHVDVKKISAQIMDEHEDVKKMSGQISKLIAKVDSLQNAITPDVTSSIQTRHARNRLVLRKKMARQPKPAGPVSVGGALLNAPATTPTPQG